MTAPGTLTLPQAPRGYDPTDQDRFRRQVELTMREVMERSAYDDTVLRVIHAAHYGVVGGNVVDDTAALNTFFAATGGVHYLPPGDYKVTSQVTITARDRFVLWAYGARLRPSGSGWSSTPVLKIGDSGGTPTRTNYLTVNGLHIVDNSASGVSAGLDLWEIFNSTFREVLIESLPGDGVALNAKGYNNRWRDCTIWLNDGDGIIDKSSGSLRWTPTFMSGCRIEGNGKHGMDWGSDQLYFEQGTLQTNATLGSTYYDARIRTNFAVFAKTQFEHPNPTSAAEERTMLFTDSGALVVVDSCAFSGNRSGATYAHTGIKQTGKIVIAKTMFRDLRDPYVEQAAGADTMLFGVFVNNNINSIPTATGSPTNFVALAGQLSPTFRSGFLEMQGSLRNSISSGRVKFDDSIGPEIVDDFIKGGIRKSFDGWWSDNVPAGIGPSGIARFGGGAAYPTKAFMVAAGSLLGVWVKSSEARTAGTLTVEVFKNGVATGLTAVLDATNTTYKLSTQGEGSTAHVAGDDYDVRVTTSGDWAPTTADIRAGIEIEE